MIVAECQISCEFTKKYKSIFKKCKEKKYLFT